MWSPRYVKLAEPLIGTEYIKWSRIFWGNILHSAARAVSIALSAIGGLSLLDEIHFMDLNDYLWII